MQQLYSVLSYSGEREVRVHHRRSNGVLGVAVFTATPNWKQINAYEQERMNRLRSA